MDKSEVAIVEIHVASPPCKSETYDEKCRGTWFFDVSYTLEDGGSIEARDYNNTKKACVAEIETLPKAPANPMFAIFHDGHYVGTKTSYYIGPKVGA